MTAFRLRPDQERVVRYRRGYMAVPAVPGAGKTTVLAYLAADLIQERLHEPGRILVVTYTNSAVANFRGRIGDFLEARGLPRQLGYEVRTIHSLAMQIIRSRPEALGWSEEFLVMDEGRLKSLLEQLTHRWIDRNRALWESLISPTVHRREQAEQQWAERTVGLMSSLIQTFKARRLSPEEARRLTRGLPEESVLRWAAELYGDYQRELNLEGAVDFGDLMLGADRLLRQEPDLLERFRRRWTYIFEDEAQDSYRLQEQVLRLLAGPDGNLVRVGDANQAIMGSFTSAEPDLFRRFTREEGVDVRPLTMAGRSNPDIIDLANELVRWVRAEHPDPPCRDAMEEQFIEPVPPGFGQENPRPEGYRVAFRQWETQEAELRSLAAQAVRSLGRAPDKSLAILLPTHAMVNRTVELLEAAGAPVRRLGGATLPERLRAARTLHAALAYLARPGDGDRLVSALGHLAGAKQPGEAAWAASVRVCDPAALFFPESGEPYAALFEKCPACRGDAGLREALEHLARWLRRTLLPPDELLLTIGGDLGLREEEADVALQLALRLRRFMEECPDADLEAAAASLEAGLQAVGRFVDMLHERKGFRAEPGVIYVTTCHAAKGLEWDTVLVGALTRAEFPSVAGDRSRSELWFLREEHLNPEALAVAELDELLGHPAPADRLRVLARAKHEIVGERLRLLYVAITRAKENLLLSCHRENAWGREVLPALAYQHLKQFAERRRP